MKTIQVTDTQIAKGERGSYCTCPIALALNEATGFQWLVTKREAECADLPNSFELPPIAQRFIDSFDLGFPVQPFAFDLPLESPQCHSQGLPQ